MNKSSKSMIVGAAMAGLFAGALASQAHASSVTTTAGTSLQLLDNDKNSCSGPNGCGKDAKAGKHDCAGKNACKGQGGCKTDANTCKGKNACKGKGGCNTNKPM